MANATTNDPTTITTTTSVWLNEVNDEGGADGVPGLGGAVVAEGFGLEVNSVVGNGVGVEVGSNKTGACIVAWGYDWMSVVDMAVMLVGSVRADASDAMEILAA